MVEFTLSALHTRLAASRRHFFWLGLAMALVGIIALGFPIISTLAAALFVGWMFLLAGIFLFVGSFAIHGTGPFFGAMLMALLMAAAGVFLLFNPLAGALALTMILGVIFLIEAPSNSRSPSKCARTAPGHGCCFQDWPALRWRW